MATNPTMSSPTTSTPAAAARSTSIPAAGSTSIDKGPDKLQVRTRTPTLTATRVRTAQRIQLSHGAYVDLLLGDWIISRAQLIVDWSRGALLEEKYEVVHEGELRLPVEIGRRLEQTTGIGSTRDPFVLVEAVERLASISIGTVHVDFTPGQMEEIAHRAKKRGHTVEQELRTAVERVKDEIFHRG
jgi:hypothetical protein